MTVDTTPAFYRRGPAKGAFIPRAKFVITMNRASGRYCLMAQGSGFMVGTSYETPDHPDLLAALADANEETA